MSGEPRTPIPTGGDAAILARLIRPDDDNLPREKAQALLHFRFGTNDIERLHDLVAKNCEDQLTPPEKKELESYLRVSALIDLMQAKARRTLKARS